MLPRNSDTDEFWQAFRRHSGLDHDHYVVGSFGDSPEMATELAGLVIAGIKRATASLARDYGEGREPTPRPGDFVIMLDGEGRPRFIWRTMAVPERTGRSQGVQAAAHQPLRGSRLDLCGDGDQPADGVRACAGNAAPRPRHGSRHVGDRFLSLGQPAVADRRVPEVPDPRPAGRRLRLSKANA